MTCPGPNADGSNVVLMAVVKCSIFMTFGALFIRTAQSVSEDACLFFAVRLASAHTAGANDSFPLSTIYREAGRTKQVFRGCCCSSNLWLMTTVR